MFWKMLKSDLKRDRGLNVILFLFMAVAAALVFISAAELYSTATEAGRTTKVCCLNDLICAFRVPAGNAEEKRARIDKAMDDSKSVAGYSVHEALELPLGTLDFADFDEMEDAEYSSYTILLTTPDPERNRICDMDDCYAAPVNGTITMPAALMTIAGAELGDTVRLTTEMGRIYEFTIAVKTKESLAETDAVMRCMVSEEDYAVLAADYPIRLALYGVDLNGGYWDGLEKFGDDMKAAGLGFWRIETSFMAMSDNSMVVFIFSLFMIIISLFVILMMCMTVRFTIIAALKREEKELGVMRALGVDSFGFRWLFAARYIFFAVVGGLVGLALGFPLSDLLMDTFGSAFIAPSQPELLCIGGAAVLCNVLLTIGFSLSVLRRIGKISVMDAIHGENRGERFKKSSPLPLHGRKKMSVPLFMAVSDILTRMKRYLFLIVTYMLSMSILLTVFNLKNSIINEEFIKYWMIYSMDFCPDLGANWRTDTFQKAEREGISYFEVFNREFEEHGIPAEIDYARVVGGKINNGGRKHGILLDVDAKHIDRMVYRKGGRAPEQPNEIALGYYFANRDGLKLGDTIELELPIPGADGVSEDTKTEQFIITGFLSALEGGGLTGVVGGTHSELTSIYERAVGYTINAEGAAKREAFRKLEEIYGEDQILTGKEYVAKYMRMYSFTFTLVEYVMGGALLLITVLLTYLYINVFLAEETTEIALLKSMGFTNGDITAWQLLRLLLLALAGTVLAEVLFRTVGTWVSRLGFHLIYLSGFGFVFELPVSFFVIPALFIAVILLTAMLKIRSVRQVAVWNITEE